MTCWGCCGFFSLASLKEWFSESISCISAFLCIWGVIKNFCLAILLSTSLYLYRNVTVSFKSNISTEKHNNNDLY